MRAEGLRYEWFLDPAEFWLVWDTVAELPAEFGQHVLMGLSKDEAEAFCRLMNELDARLVIRGARDAAQTG